MTTEPLQPPADAHMQQLTIESQLKEIRELKSGNETLRKLLAGEQKKNDDLRSEREGLVYAYEATIDKMITELTNSR